MSEYDRADLTDDEVARIMKSFVAPRPIGWISSMSADGVDNLAPFSSYTYASSTKPVILFNNSGVAESGLKHTTENILETEEFVVNLVTEELTGKMRATSAGVPAEQSEFDTAGVERADSVTVAPPRVADAKIHLECTLYDSVEVYDSRMTLGEVQHFHVDESVTTDGKVDMAKLRLVARCGGPYYARLELFE